VETRVPPAWEAIFWIFDKKAESEYQLFYEKSRKWLPVQAGRVFSLNPKTPAFPPRMTI